MDEPFELTRVGCARQVASAAAEARRQAEAAATEGIEAAVAERANSRLMESLRKARDLGRQKVRDWSTPAG